jgi:hypothetical protein
MKLAILIYGNADDEFRIKMQLSSLQKQLNVQGIDDIEVLYFYDNDEASIEEKKMWLLQRTEAKYYTFLNADVKVDDYFVLKRINAIKQGLSETLLELETYYKPKKIN